MVIQSSNFRYQGATAHRTGDLCISQKPGAGAGTGKIVREWDLRDRAGEMRVGFWLDLISKFCNLIMGSSNAKILIIAKNYSYLKFNVILDIGK